ncbi:MAG TPA: hypothetical protein VLI05_06235 [Candidatus Saccharimonadia bacterium]|nr:hypothetical protein [Candidatus Saccharimonadia bacterium]
MTRNRLKAKKWWLIGGLLVVLIVAGVAAYAARQAGRTTTVNPQTADTVGSPTPTPSPGQPGNPGDTAKSQGGGATPTPAPTPTPAASIVLSDVTVASRGGGQIHVTSQLVGATAGSCTLALTSPSAQVQSVGGTISWSGTYYFCSFDTISTVTEAGTWSAKLTAAGSAGQGSNAVTTSFQVTN